MNAFSGLEDIVKKILLIAALMVSFAVLFGCADSDDKAAELEQQMNELEGKAAEDSGMAPDSVTHDEAMTPDETESMTEPEPEETVPDFSGTPADAGLYTVQIASCEDPQYAEHLVNVYKNRGYEPYVVSALVEGQTYYRVRLGGFAAFSEAKSMQAEILDRFSVEGWIAETD